MSHVSVERVHGGATESVSLLNEVKALGDRIRQGAYNLFQRRGLAEGSAADDWLKAERELISVPESDLIEKNGAFELQVAVPGFDTKDIRVTAMPDTLVVRAECTHKHEEGGGQVYFCGFNEKQLFRSVDLPAPIDVDRVTAHVEKGVLHITAATKQPASQAAAASAS